jgi:hypothetical protein
MSISTVRFKPHSLYSRASQYYECEQSEEDFVLLLFKQIEYCNTKFTQFEAKFRLIEQ